MSPNKTIAASLATLAVIATLGACGTSADVSQSVERSGRQAGASPAPTTRPNGEQADKATQVHMEITNNTKETLNLTSASSSGTGNHWQDRPVSLAPGQVETVSNYAAGSATINLTYTAATSQAVFTLMGETPLGSSNKITGTSTDPSYTVNTENASGYNPTFTYNIEPGNTFTYTGHTETYTVPIGITQLNVTAIGGPGGVNNLPVTQQVPSGAEITGTLAVTPGEVLTVGVGGAGQFSSTSSTGGWGLDIGSSSFSGGNGNTGAFRSGGGGGATVVQDGSGQIVLVAGGAGGQGGQRMTSNGYLGGEGGADGSLAGGQGQPGGTAGGAGGSNTVTRGQDAQGPSQMADAGAGGGGVNGGLAGSNGTGAGGGAGSSSDSGLTNPAVQPAPHSNSYPTDGQVTFGAVD